MIKREEENIWNIISLIEDIKGIADDSNRGMEIIELCSFAIKNLYEIIKKGY